MLKLMVLFEPFGCVRRTLSFSVVGASNVSSGDVFSMLIREQILDAKLSG